MQFLHLSRFTLLSLLFVTLVQASPLPTPLSPPPCVPHVRREWRSLAPAERTRFINAVNCLASKPHNSILVPSVDPSISQIPPLNPESSYYDDYVYAHMDLNTRIHGTGLFFPWHRAYIKNFVNTLRSQCGYQDPLPYWNWTKDTADFYNATIFDPSNTTGIGQWGDPNNDFQITNGGFANMEMVYPGPHRIRRAFTLQPWQIFGNPFAGVPNAPPFDVNVRMNDTITAEIINGMINGHVGNFSEFQTIMEGPAGPHTAIHLILGGDMSGLCPAGLFPPACIPGMKWSSNDPIFWLHHSFVDKIWWDWQNKNPNNFWAYGGGSVTSSNNATLYLQYPTGGPPFLNLDSPVPGDGLWNNVTVRDLMDIRNPDLCYCYA